MHFVSTSPREGRLHSFPSISKSLFFKPIPMEPRKIVEQVNELYQENQGNLPDLRQIFELGRRYEALHFESRRIEAETTGIWSFFRYFLNWGALTEKRSLVKDMQMQSVFIEDVMKAYVPQEQQPQENLDENKETLTAVEPLKSDSIESQVEVQPPPPPQDQSIPPPPPPPPGAPPPPPMGRKQMGSDTTKGTETVGKSLSPQQKHELAERNRLERNLKERANPDVFYAILPPKNARELQEKWQELTDDIAIFETIQGNPDATKRLQTKRAALKNVDEQLKPQKTLLQYANQQQKAQFVEKIGRYTNQELDIIIGILFDGKKPDASHPDFQFYLFNKQLLDPIFNDWHQLAAGEKGQVFMEHAEGWKRNLYMNKFGFLSILKLRMLPAKNKEHLPEPVYVITPFGEKKGNRLQREAEEKMPGNVVEELRKRNREKGTINE